MTWNKLRSSLPAELELMTWDSHDIEIQKWKNMYSPYYS
jgi:hypothetical protein